MDKKIMLAVSTILFLLFSWGSASAHTIKQSLPCAGIALMAAGLGVTLLLKIKEVKQ